jgi:hypothetical protein
VNWFNEHVKYRDVWTILGGIVNSPRIS